MGKTYRVIYDHFRLDPKDKKSTFFSELMKAVEDAKELGQIEESEGRNDLFMCPAFTRCTIQIENEGWENVAVGYAFCSPNDQFSRRKGRLIAENRAFDLFDTMMNQEDVIGSIFKNDALFNFNDVWSNDV